MYCWIEYIATFVSPRSALVKTDQLAMLDTENCRLLLHRETKLGIKLHIPPWIDKERDIQNDNQSIDIFSLEAENRVVICREV